MWNGVLDQAGIEISSSIFSIPNSKLIPNKGDTGYWVIPVLLEFQFPIFSIPIIMDLSKFLINSTHVRFRRESFKVRSTPPHKS